MLYLALLGALAYASVLLAPVLILIFSSVLVAILLDAAALLLRRHVFRRPPSSGQMPWVLGVVALSGVFLLALVLLLGPRVAEQLSALSEKLPRAVERLRVTLGELGVAAESLPSLEAAGALLEPGSFVGQRIFQAFGSIVGALGSALVVFVIGLYLALQPQPYLRGVLMLVPAGRTEQVRQVLEATHHALRQWLLGRIAAMLAVFLLTTVTLWLLDAPLALSMGLLAGVLTFIPFIGPWLAAVPAVLLGLLQSELQAVWIGVAYVGVQAVEGNLITPMIQSYAVSLRPALLVSAQLVAGGLFGLPGILVATPMAVVVVVFVQVLYVRHHLGKQVVPLGQA